MRGVLHVDLTNGTALPDRDFILTCANTSVQQTPLITCVAEDDPDEWYAYLMATVTPLYQILSPIPRELIILVDHSDSMEGPQRATVNRVVVETTGNSSGS